MAKCEHMETTGDVTCGMCKDKVSEKLVRYAELEKRADAIATEQAALKVLIIADMKEQNLGSVSHAVGTFSIKKTSKWEYTPAIDVLEDMLGQAKEDERDRGMAKVVETETLRYQAPKEKKAKKV